MKEVIKEVIYEIFAENGIEISSIILFGSRARGEATKRSDWDLLIIIKKDISREDELRISHMIRRRLAEEFIPCDVLIRSEKKLKREKMLLVVSLKV
jgi:predicted nucleotidyltransferase